LSVKEIEREPNTEEEESAAGFANKVSIYFAISACVCVCVRICVRVLKKDHATIWPRHAFASASVFFIFILYLFSCDI